MSGSLGSSRPLTVLLYGEALFDRIGGVTVLGGAPANTGVHLAAMLGANGSVHLVSARGRDALGDRLEREVGGRGLRTDLLQTVDEPTGVVEVTVSADGQPTYRIDAPAAWDRIAWTPELAGAAPTADVIVSGTLAQRDPVSRATLGRLLENAPDATTVCDLNLRPPDDSEAVIRDSVAWAGILKVNADELAVLRGLFGLDADDDTAAAELLAHAGLEQVILTRGARGTTIVTDRGVFTGVPSASHDPDDARGPADAVGAGDACLAACLAARFWDLGPVATATYANRVGAFVASHPGATPALPGDLLTAPR